MLHIFFIELDLIRVFTSGYAEELINTLIFEMMVICMTFFLNQRNYPGCARLHKKRDKLN